MNYRKVFPVIIVTFAIIVLSGCSTKVTKMNKNVYMAYSTGAGFNPANEVANVKQAADELAEKEGKIVVPIDLKTQQGILGNTPPSATFQFKLVDKDSEEAKSVENTASEQMGIKKLSVTNPDINTNKTEKKLADAKSLFLKGLITEKEYKQMRQKIILNP